MYERVNLSGALYGVAHGPALRFRAYLKPPEYQRVVADWAPVAVLQTEVVSQAAAAPSGTYTKVAMGPLNGILHADNGRLRFRWAVVGYIGLVGEARYRPTAEIGSDGSIAGEFTVNAAAAVGFEGTLEPKNVTGDFRAGGITAVDFRLEALPGEFAVSGAARVGFDGYARSFMQTDGAASVGFAKVVQALKGLRMDGLTAVVFGSEHMKQATFAANGQASVEFAVRAGMSIECVVGDGDLPAGGVRNYAM